MAVIGNNRRSDPQYLDNSIETRLSIHPKTETKPHTNPSPKFRPGLPDGCIAKLSTRPDDPRRGLDLLPPSFPSYRSGRRGEG
uniref:Uncharacterized protein n=1 Tax=Kalanchoe fedtschenkoi TaxID=63787 RepID=A0A7N0ZTG4_KALFE